MCSSPRKLLFYFLYDSFLLLLSTVVAVAVIIIAISGIIIFSYDLCTSTATAATKPNSGGVSGGLHFLLNRILTDSSSTVLILILFHIHFLFLSFFQLLPLSHPPTKFICMHLLRTLNSFFLYACHVISRICHLIMLLPTLDTCTLFLLFPHKTIHINSLKYVSRSY